RAALASLAPLVLGAADAGDGVAADLVREGASELAGLMQAALQQLGLGSDPVPLALAGGLLLGSASYRQQLLQVLQRLCIPAAPARGRLGGRHGPGIRPPRAGRAQEPAQGAVRRARANLTGADR